MPDTDVYREAAVTTGEREATFSAGQLFRSDQYTIRVTSGRVVLETFVAKRGRRRAPSNAELRRLAAQSPPPKEWYDEQDRPF